MANFETFAKTLDLTVCNKESNAHSLMSLAVLLGVVMMIIS